MFSILASIIDTSTQLFSNGLLVYKFSFTVHLKSESAMIAIHREKREP